MVFWNTIHTSITILYYYSVFAGVVAIAIILIRILSFCYYYWLLLTFIVITIESLTPLKGPGVSEQKGGTKRTPHGHAGFAPGLHVFHRGFFDNLCQADVEEEVSLRVWGLTLSLQNPLIKEYALDNNRNPN